MIFVRFIPPAVQSLPKEDTMKQTRYTLPVKGEGVELPNLEPDGPLVEGAT